MIQPDATLCNFIVSNSKELMAEEKEETLRLNLNKL